MKKGHENIPECSIVPTGLFKSWAVSLTGAIPTELPPHLLKWWSGQHFNGVSGTSILTEMMRDLFYNPPTLGNEYLLWQRFYKVFFGITLPEFPVDFEKSDSWRQQFSEGYVFICKEATEKLQGVIGIRSYLDLFLEKCRVPYTAPKTWFRNLSSIDFPFVLLHIDRDEEEVHPLSVKCPDHTYEELDKNELTFDVLLIQQLYAYWRNPRLETGWLYAPGSRTADGKVLAICWKKGELNIRDFRRKEIRKNLRVNYRLALK